jgi:hypothetical protein
VVAEVSIGKCSDKHPYLNGFPSQHTQPNWAGGGALRHSTTKPLPPEAQKPPPHSLCLEEDEGNESVRDCRFPWPHLEGYCTSFHPFFISQNSVT